MEYLMFIMQIAPTEALPTDENIFVSLPKGGNYAVQLWKKEFQCTVNWLHLFQIVNSPLYIRLEQEKFKLPLLWFVD